jgi:hypothetical protein
MVESEIEGSLVQFCFSRQAQRHSASVEDVVDYMREAGKQIDRFCVNRFVERNAEKLPPAKQLFSRQIATTSIQMRSEPTEIVAGIS